MNRTPITGDIDAARDKRDIDLFGCGLHHTRRQGTGGRASSHRLNIITPLHADHSATARRRTSTVSSTRSETAVGKAVRKAHRPNSRAARRRRTSCSTTSTTVIADVSGDGEYRFNVRQLFYALRPIVMDETGRGTARSATSRRSSPTTRTSTAKSRACIASRAARSRIRTATRRSRSAP